MTGEARVLQLLSTSVFFVSRFLLKLKTFRYCQSSAAIMVLRAACSSIPRFKESDRDGKNC